MTQPFRTLYQIEETIRDALAHPLQGPTAHLTLAPRPRRGWHPGQIPPKARMAAALVLIYPLAEEPHLLLTVRTDQLAQHAGQVSFPGGGLEPNETIDKAALRETEEEVGLDPKQVHLIGALSPLYIPVSDFALYPIVGVTHYPHAWQSAAAEVRRVLEAPVTELLTTAGPHRGYLCDKNHPCRVPYFEVGGERVWGATAMILAELMTAIGASVKDPWDNLDTEESETS